MFFCSIEYQQRQNERTTDSGSDFFQVESCALSKDNLRDVSLISQDIESENHVSTQVKSTQHGSRVIFFSLILIVRFRLSLNETRIQAVF